MSTGGTCPRCGTELENDTISVELGDGETVMRDGVRCPDCTYVDY